MSSQAKCVTSGRPNAHVCTQVHTGGTDVRASNKLRHRYVVTLETTNIEMLYVFDAAGPQRRDDVM